MGRDAWDAVILYAKVMAASIAMVWGNLPLLAQVLMVLMAADVAVGLLAAFGTRTLDANACWRGITKKAIVLIIVGACGYVGPAVGIPLGEAVAGFYSAHELLSIIQNTDRAGLPIPTVLRDALTKLTPTLEPPGGQGKGEDRHG